MKTVDEGSQNINAPWQNRVSNNTNTAAANTTTATTTNNKKNIIIPAKD